MPGANRKQTGSRPGTIPVQAGYNAENAEGAENKGKKTTGSGCSRQSGAGLFFFVCACCMRGSQEFKADAARGSSGPDRQVRRGARFRPRAGPGAGLVTCGSQVSSLLNSQASGKFPAFCWALAVFLHLSKSRLAGSLSKLSKGPHSAGNHSSRLSSTSQKGLPL